MSGDPYREDSSLLRERLRELREKHSVLLTRVRCDSLLLEQRFQSARVAERGLASTKQQKKTLLGATVWGVIFFVGGVITVFGRWAVLILFVAPFAILVAAVVLRLLRRPRARLFDPTRYELDTAPAHLLAARKWLDRDRDEADELAQEIREADELLAAQEKRDSR